MFLSISTRALQFRPFPPYGLRVTRFALVFLVLPLLGQLTFAQNDDAAPITPLENKPARMSATEMLRDAQFIHIQSSTKFFDPFQLESELQKQSEFGEWNLMLVDKPGAADIQVDIDRPLFTYLFNYRVVDRRTSVVLATGKVTAINGTAAAPKLAQEIIEQVKAARPPQASKIKAEADFIDQTLIIPGLPRELKKAAGIQQGAQEALTKAPLTITRPPAQPRQ